MDDARPPVEMRAVASLRPHAKNIRWCGIEDLDVSGLAASIREVGILSPLVITPGGTVIAGHRRLAACTDLGIESVPVIVRDVDEVAQVQIMLAENLQREDLLPSEIARGYKALKDTGLSIVEVASRVGVSNTTVSAYLAIAELDDAVLEAIDCGELPISSAKEILRLKNEPELQRRVVHQVHERALRCEEVRLLVSSLVTPRTAEPRKQESPKPAPARGPAPAIVSGEPAARACDGSSPKVGVGKGVKDDLIEHLYHAVTYLDREPSLVKDLIIREWVERLAAAWRRANGVSVGS